MSSPARMVCAVDPQEHPPLDLAWFLAVVGLVRLPAFAWGLGTAIGELPPFFAARAARLAGEEDEGHLDVMKLAEKADRDGLATLQFSDRAMVVSYRMMRHLGFWGIMLLASVRAGPVHLRLLHQDSQRRGRVCRAADPEPAL